jgi:hypothetical protein
MVPITVTRAVTTEMRDAMDAAGLHYRFLDGQAWAPTAQDAAETEAFIAAWVDPPPPVPQEVSLRQLLFALVATGFISGPEALAAARTGDLPASLEAAIKDGMSVEGAFAVDLTWAAMYSAERTNPLWTIVVAKGIATPEQVDDVFRIAATV